jgi:hypothetical protein
MYSIGARFSLSLAGEEAAENAGARAGYSALLIDRYVDRR